MQDWEKRCPFLEENIDQLVGNHSRRSLPLDAMWLHMPRRQRDIRVEKFVGVDAGSGPAALLQLFLERID